RFVLLCCAVSTFAARCKSTNGPFLIERGIALPVPVVVLQLAFFAFVAAPDDHAVRTLVGPCFQTFRLPAPGTGRMTATVGATFTTAMRVVHRVHGNTANLGPPTTPALGAGLAQRSQRMLAVADLADTGAAVDMHTADLTRAQAQANVLTITRRHLHGRAGTAA